MSNTSFDSTGLQFAWDATSISLAETCLRKYKYRMIDRWQHPTKSVHLIFGGHYATAQEHFQKYLAAGDDRDTALLKVVKEALIATWEHPVCDKCEGRGWYDATEEARKSMKWAGHVDHARTDCEECETRGFLLGGKPWESMHNAKTRSNLIRTIVWYADHFAADNLETVILSDGRAAVEHSFSIDIDDGLVLCGHIDRLVTYSGDYYVQDQKTTGTTLTPRYFEQFNPDTQMSCYTFAGKMIYNLQVKGVVIDAAQIAVGFSRFERGFTFRTPTQLEEWYEGALYHIERARQATAEDFFPMNLSSCGNYGGCEYRSICSRSPEVRGQFLKGEFVQGEPWDPLKRR